MGLMFLPFVLCNRGILPAVDLVGDQVLVGVSICAVSLLIYYGARSFVLITFVLHRSSTLLGSGYSVSSRFSAFGLFRFVFYLRVKSTYSVFINQKRFISLLKVATLN